MGLTAIAFASWGESLIRSAPAMLRAISSWTSKTSSICRSKRSAQAASPVPVWISCALTRSRLPARRRLPLTT